MDNTLHWKLPDVISRDGEVSTEELFHLITNLFDRQVMRAIKALQEQQRQRFKGGRFLEGE